MKTAAGKPASPFAGRRILNYQRSTEHWLFHPALRDGRFNLTDVPAMLLDNAVNIALLTIYGPLFGATWEVKANSKEIKTFIENTLYRFWHHDLMKVLQHYVPYGTACAEVMYEIDPDSGLWKYAGMDDFHTLDVQAKRDVRTRKLTGAAVNSWGGYGMGNVVGDPRQDTNEPNILRFPKLFWANHRASCGQPFGKSTLEAAWAPWMEKAGSHGALSSRRLWTFSNAFRGCIVLYPPGSSTRADSEIVPNAVIAKEIAEGYCTGAALYVPNDIDPETHKPLWEIIDPKINGETKVLIDYPVALDKEIWQGMGVLPEVISAPETGGSWSGRSGPLLIFLNTEDMRVREIITAFDVGPSGYTTRNEQAGGVIRSLVMENFGPKAKYQIVPISLVPKPAEPGAGGSPQSAPGAAQPPPPPQGGGMPPEAGGGAPPAEPAPAPMGPPPGPQGMGGAPPQAMGPRPIKLSDSGVEIPDEAVEAILRGETVLLSSADAFHPIAAGLALYAQDTGRVLMLQRAHNELDPAGGTWEFPGGHIDGREMSCTAAQREWQEEVGVPLPSGTIMLPLAWESSNGVYAGFIYPVPSEAWVDLHRRDSSWNPDGDTFEAVAWVDPEDFRNHNLRKELLKDVTKVRRALKQTATQLSAETIELSVTEEDLSLSATLFDEAEHPRGDAGRFTFKPIKGEHVKAAQKAFKAGKISVKSSTSPIISDASGEQIHHHVTLESGQRIHPDELHRLRVEDGEAVLHHDEGLTIHEPDGKSEASSFGQALGKVAAFSNRPDDPVTIVSKHGYSATRPRKEWTAMHDDTRSDMPRSRDELRQAGYMDMHASSDLLPYGYQIRHWFNPSEKKHAIEYRWREGTDPRKNKKAKNVGDVVIHNYKEQAAFHKSIGANVTPPGEAYEDVGHGDSQDWLYGHEEPDAHEHESFSAWYDREGQQHTGRRVEHDGSATMASEEDTADFFAPGTTGQGRLQFSAAWDEDAHPRGQPKNKGEFAKKGQSTRTEPAEGTVTDDAASDYAANGTRSKAFKAWFGDWENDAENASKVVNADGEPQQTHEISGAGSEVIHGGKPIIVYHGTAKGGFDAFSKDKIADDNLYGPGFYFTESQGIADSYREKDKEHQIPITEAQAAGIESDLATMLPPGWAMEQREEATSSPYAGSTMLRGPGGQKISRVVKRLLKKPVAEYGELLDYIPDRLGFDDAARAKWESALQARGIVRPKDETKACYLNIRNPFRLDQAYDIKEARRVFGAWMDGVLKKSPYYDHEIPGKVLYDVLASKGKHVVNHALREAGYDGMTHIGGTIMGGGTEHRVWIAFEPNQIKSVDNKGTFDPNTDDMRLSGNWDEEKHPRGNEKNKGEFAPKGQAASSPPPKPAQSKLGAAATAVASLPPIAAAMGIAHDEWHGLHHAATEAFHALPQVVQDAAATAVATAFSGWTEAQELAERISRERGFTKEQAAQARQTLSGWDLALFKPVFFGAETMGLHGLMGASWIIPPATGAYLLYSTAANPLASLRAAWSILKDDYAGGVKKFVDEHTQKLSADDEDPHAILVDALESHHWDDWYSTLLHIAILKTHNAAEAVALADRVIQKHPESKAEPREDDAEALFSAAPKTTSLSATRAPSGYTRQRPLTIQGHTYIGGEFIPGDVMAKATAQEKAAATGRATGTEHGTPQTGMGRQHAEANAAQARPQQPVSDAQGMTPEERQKTFEQAWPESAQRPVPQPSQSNGRQQVPTPTDPAQRAQFEKEDYQLNGTKATAFKNWFGDWEAPKPQPNLLQRALAFVRGQFTAKGSEAPSSVVTDHHGQPLVVYHGTSANFDAFDPAKSNPNSLLGPGHYFTDNQSVAESYQKGNALREDHPGEQHDAPRTIKAYLNIRNPFDVDAWASRLISAPGVAKFSYEALADIKRGNPAATKKLQELGYDGITHAGEEKGSRHRVWIAFHPNQIKGVDNQGSFDPNKAEYKLSAAHAPAGYTHDHPLTIQGGYYIGGQFIPPEVMAQATAQEKAAVSGATPRGSGRENAAPQTGMGRQHEQAHAQEARDRQNRAGGQLLPVPHRPGSQPPNQAQEDTYIKVAMKNLARTSRTAKGTVDASASAGKAEKMAEGVSGEQAAERATKNFEVVMRGLYRQRRDDFSDPRRLQVFCDNINRELNKGITKEGVLLRTDDSDKFPYTKVADMDLAREQFSQEFANRLNDPHADPIETAAWVEWRTNIDHVYADGCGKTQRALAALPLMRANLPLPNYDDPKKMFRYMPKTPIDPKEGPQAYTDRDDYRKFLNYYRMKCPAYGSRVIRNLEKHFPPANPLGVDALERHSTGVDEKGRPVYSAQRQALHATIAAKLRGHVPASQDKTYHLMGGGPASGKSSVIKMGLVKIPEHHVHLDSDQIKGELPEMVALRHAGDMRAADYVHEESSDLAKKLQSASFGDGQDVILDGTGDSSVESMEKKIKEARSHGYKVHASYTTCSVDEAVRRNVIRAYGGEKARSMGYHVNDKEMQQKPEGRLPPEDMLRAVHKGVSTVLPEAIKKGLFDHLTLHDTEHRDAEGKPVLVATAQGTQLQVHHPELWEKFLGKANVQLSAGVWDSLKHPRGGTNKGWFAARHHDDGDAGGGGGAAQDGEGNDDPHAHLFRLIGLAEDALQESGLAPTMQDEYRRGFTSVLQEMSPIAITRLSRHTMQVVFYGSHPELTAAVNAKYPAMKAKKLLKGCFDQDGVLHLDGGGTIRGKPVALPGFYAHEMTHGIDGTRHEISQSAAWKHALRDEKSLLQDDEKERLTATEGFAKFGQMLFSGKYTREELAKLMPNCLKVWESHGL